MYDDSWDLSVCPNCLGRHVTFELSGMRTMFVSFDRYSDLIAYGTVSTTAER